MAENRDIGVFFAGISIAGGTSQIKQLAYPGYSLTSFTAGDRKSLAANETTAANIASTVCTLIQELKYKGIIT